MRSRKRSGLNQIGPPPCVPTTNWHPLMRGYFLHKKPGSFTLSKELKEFREKHGISNGRLTDELALLRQEISLANGQATTGKRRLPSLPKLRFLEEPENPKKI